MHGSLFEASKCTHVGRHVYAEKISLTLQNLLQMAAKTKLCLRYISELFLKISSARAQLVYYLYLGCIISINVCITCSTERKKKLAWGILFISYLIKFIFRIFHDIWIPRFRLLSLLKYVELWIMGRLSVSADKEFFFNIIITIWR